MCSKISEIKTEIIWINIHISINITLKTNISYDIIFNCKSYNNNHMSKSLGGAKVVRRFVIG